MTGNEPDQDSSFGGLCKGFLAPDCWSRCSVSMVDPHLKCNLYYADKRVLIFTFFSLEYVYEPPVREKCLFEIIIGILVLI